MLRPLITVLSIPSWLFQEIHVKGDSWILSAKTIQVTLFFEGIGFIRNYVIYFFTAVVDLLLFYEFKLFFKALTIRVTKDIPLIPEITYALGHIYNGTKPKRNTCFSLWIYVDWVNTCISTQDYFSPPQNPMELLFPKPNQNNFNP